MEPRRIKRRIIEVPVDAPQAARRRATPPSLHDEGIVLTSRHKRAQAAASAMLARSTQPASGRSGSWFTDAEIKAMYDRRNGTDRWDERKENAAALNMLEQAGVPKHKAYAMAASQRLTRRMAQEHIGRMPRTQR